GRLGLITPSVLSARLLLLAIAPGLFNPLFEVFNFEPGNGQRLTAVLLFAVAIQFLLLIRMQSEVDTSERGIRQLVESFGQSAFDWDLAADLPAGKRIMVVSPPFNEAENVGAVIDAMPREVEGYHVVAIVVDDHSDDGTAEAARGAGGRGGRRPPRAGGAPGAAGGGGAAAAPLPIRRGGGLALRVGYDIALKLGADIVVTMDADGQHQPEELPTLVGPIIEGRADHVNGSRMLGDFEREGLIRHLGVYFFSRVVTILTGQRGTNTSSGYRAPRADTLRALILEQDQFWTSEVTIEALRQRARVVEVPVTFLTRRGGVSKKPKSLRYGWNFSKAIVKTWLR